MKIVVDTNILFSFFKKNSFTRQFIFTNQDLELISPNLTLKELKKYSKEILRKSKLTIPQFNYACELLHSLIDFVPLAEYQDFFTKAKIIAQDFSKKDYEEFMNDIDFFALALKENCPIWSKDKLFKKQNKILIFKTEELIKLLG